MGVGIDKARAGYESGSIYNSGRFAFDFSHSGNLFAADGDVTKIGFAACPIGGDGKSENRLLSN